MRFTDRHLANENDITLGIIKIRKRVNPVTLANRRLARHLSDVTRQLDAEPPNKNFLCHFQEGGCPYSINE